MNFVQVRASINPITSVIGAIVILVAAVKLFLHVAVSYSVADLALVGIGLLLI